jgi:cytochrome b pre-mRNA-processing protein 3
MILRLFARSKPDPVPQQLYGAVVAQARKPAFYLEHGFKDTVTGRFDVLALHMFLFSRRLSSESDPAAAPLSQEVFDTFTDGVDDALRALGIGDTSVPKRKQAMVRGFYAQIEEFAPPIDAGDVDGLARAVSKRFFSGANPGESTRIAAYMLESAGMLAAQDFGAISSGRLNWPDPA